MLDILIYRVFVSCFKIRTFPKEAILNLKIDSIWKCTQKIYASDLDSDYGLLQFSLENDDAEIFRLDSESGEIFLNKAVDYEKQTNYKVCHDLISGEYSNGSSMITYP